MSVNACVDFLYVAIQSTFSAVQFYCCSQTCTEVRTFSRKFPEGLYVRTQMSANIAPYIFLELFLQDPLAKFLKKNVRVSPCWNTAGKSVVGVDATECSKMFPVGVNASDSDGPLLRSSYVKGKLQQMSRPIFPDIFRSLCLAHRW